MFESYNIHKRSQQQGEDITSYITVLMDCSVQRDGYMGSGAG